MKGKKLLVLSMAFILALLLNAKIFAVSNNTPVGYWQTVDDKTGEILSVVHITQTPNQTLQGKIVKIMPVLGQKPTDVCTQCKGDLKGKPMMGLVVISEMQKINDDTWGKGRVLDPKSGKFYKARMTLLDEGKNLKLRGYVWLPVLGNLI